MARRPRHPSADFDQLLASDFMLAESDAQWLRRGYVRSSARLWRCRDGSYTARLVWRHRGARLSTITYIVRGMCVA